MKVFISKNLLSKGLSMPCIQQGSVLSLSQAQWCEGWHCSEPRPGLMPKEGNVLLVIVGFIIAVRFLLRITRIDTLQRMADEYVKAETAKKRLKSPSNLQVQSAFKMQSLRKSANGSCSFASACVKTKIMHADVLSSKGSHQSEELSYQSIKLDCGPEHGLRMPPLLLSFLSFGHGSCQPS